MLGGSAGVSRDVLAGRDLEVTWEDVYRGTWLSLRAMLLEKGLPEETDFSDELS